MSKQAYYLTDRQLKKLLEQGSSTHLRTKEETSWLLPILESVLLVLLAIPVAIVLFVALL